MKKLILSTFVFFVFLVSFAQDRINRPQLEFKTSSDFLTNSIGWAYNKELGEWIDYPNIVCQDKSYKTKYSSLIGGNYHMSRFESFKTMRIQTLDVNHVKYYVLTILKVGGRYEYPSIMEDWYTFPLIESYVFSETEYQNIKNFKNAKVLSFVKYDLGFQEYDKSVLLDKIQTSLSQINTQSEYHYLFPIYVSTNGQIRFFIPSYKSDFIGKQIGDRFFEPKYDMINGVYFETSKVEFSKLFVD